MMWRLKTSSYSSLKYYPLDDCVSKYTWEHFEFLECEEGETKTLDDVYWLFWGFGVRRLAGVSGIAAEASVIVPAHFIILAVMGPCLTLIYVWWLAEGQRVKEEKYWTVKNSWMTILASRTSKTHTNSTRSMKQSCENRVKVQDSVGMVCQGL